MSASRPKRMTGQDVIRLLRPTQWSKNLVVGAAFFFAYFDRTRATPLGPADFARVLQAIALFCAASSGVYIVNDILDRRADREHPVKRNRPIAAGLIAPRLALVMGGAILLIALAGSLLLAPAFAQILGAYVLMQLVYSLLLKHIPLLDIMIIASGFVLRALAGAMVLPGIGFSAWLLLCTFLLALFLALCKRRHERRLFDSESPPQTRQSLAGYTTQLLDQLIAIAAAATIVAYAIYTLWPETVEKFGTTAMGFTIPFVVFGIFRYLDLVYRREGGDRPEKILLTDIPLLIDLFLYALAVIVICGWRPF